MATINEFLSELERETHGDIENAHRILHDYLQRGLSLPDRLKEPGLLCHARHLVHRSEESGLCVVATVWAPGQSTDIQDLGGTWCVEGCLQGRLRVSNYRILQMVGGARVKLRVAQSGVLEKGSVAALQPPFEYHRISNPYAEPALTLCVYGQEPQNCQNLYEVAPGNYQFQEAALGYTTTTTTPNPSPVTPASTGT